MNSLKIKLVAVILGLTAISCNGQTKPVEHKGPITWMSFEDAVAKSRIEPRKMFIDVYTDWCGWCKRMDATTFQDSVIVKYMGEKFYAVKLNAETRDTIHFFDKLFVYEPENKTNSLASSLLSNQMSYPSFVMLDEKFNMLSPLPGYQTPDQLMRVVRYFGDNIYLTKKWDDYSRELQGGN